MYFPSVKTNCFTASLRVTIARYLTKPIWQNNFFGFKFQWSVKNWRTLNSFWMQKSAIICFSTIYSLYFSYLCDILSKLCIMHLVTCKVWGKWWMGCLWHRSCSSIKDTKASRGGSFWGLRRLGEKTSNSTTVQKARQGWVTSEHFVTWLMLRVGDCLAGYVFVLFVCVFVLFRRFLKIIQIYF